jgi:hypothetical protein
LLNKKLGEFFDETQLRQRMPARMFNTNHARLRQCDGTGIDFYMRRNTYLVKSASASLLKL